MFFLHQLNFAQVQSKGAIQEKKCKISYHMKFLFLYFIDRILYYKKLTSKNLQAKIFNKNVFALVSEKLRAYCL